MRREPVCGRAGLGPGLRSWWVDAVWLGWFQFLGDPAFAVFFFNRTNRSGIIGGGIIGGQNQTPASTRTSSCSASARSAVTDRITLTNLAAAVLLNDWSSRDDDAFFYLDRPYCMKGEGLYDNFYAPEDHQALAKAVLALRHPWVVSYDAAPDVIAMYSDARSLRYRLSYSAHERQAAFEVMFYSPDLHIPEVLRAGISMHSVDAARSSAT